MPQRLALTLAPLSSQGRYASRKQYTAVHTLPGLILATEALQPSCPGNLSDQSDQVQDLFAVANSQSSYVLLSPRLLSYAKTLFFIGSCSASFCAASAGTFLLLYLFVSTSLAPPADRFRQDLLLDYSKPAAVAAVSFLPNTPPGAHTALKAGLEFVVAGKAARVIGYVPLRAV